MSSAFCSLDEAFSGPVMPLPGGKKKKDKSHKEGFVPGPLSGSPLSGSPDMNRGIPEAMAPPPDNGSKPESAAALHDFFPLPGETAEPEEWAKAFSLEGSNMPRPDGAVSVAGKSTLWRKIPVAASASASVAIAPNHSMAAGSDVYQRLDALTKQLDSLTSASPMQSTAELFLFIAIGLLFLLAIDTLLRCATSIALAAQGRGSIMNGGGIYRGGSRGYGLSRRWRG
jgi:hypothetical protein